MADAAAVDTQRIRGKNNLFIIVRNCFQRTKFLFHIFRGKNMANLNIDPLILTVGYKIDFQSVLLSDIDRKPPAKKLQIYRILQSAGNIIVPDAAHCVAKPQIYKIKLILCF